MGEGSKPTTARPDVVEWDPYLLWSEDRCSTVGLDADEIEAFARQDLETQTSHKIESILWSNLVDSADFGASHPNISLSDASTTISQPNGWTSYPIVTAFRDMIDALRDTIGGARGMIHVDVRLLPVISFMGLAVERGGRLITTLGDHVVVPGTGYTGTDPAGNSAGQDHSWIYGTTMVELLLTPIEVYTSIDRSDNIADYRAERMALAHWDRQAHIGIPVCLEDPQGDCSDSGS